MFNILSNSPMYDPNAVQYMRDELVAVGFTEIFTPDDVAKYLDVKDDEVKLVFINSVCGCAAGSARPGVSLALQNEKIPNKLFTIFAGQERDAVDYFRKNFLAKFPPSSPCIALFKNGELISFMQRYDIEGNSAEYISSELISIFDEVCTAQGPSVSKEQLGQIEYAKQCGSKIPLFSK